MALLIDPIIIILLVVITQSGHIPTALKVILCIVLACVGTIMGICTFRGGGE
jgi:Cu/Ag efflux pump CusA